MAVKYSIHVSEKLVRMEFSGSITVDDFAFALDGVFNSPEYQPGFGILVDRRRASPPRPEHLNKIIAFGIVNRRKLAIARWAVVESKARLVELTDGEGQRASADARIQAFADLDAAETWLRTESQQLGFHEVALTHHS
jgi:hypothetical protein